MIETAGTKVTFAERLKAHVANCAAGPFDQEPVCAARRDCALSVDPGLINARLVAKLAWALVSITLVRAATT